MYAYFLCRLVCTYIHESDAELTLCVHLRRFTILCYASGFYMLIFLRQLFMMRSCVCVCCGGGGGGGGAACVRVWFICIVQCN